MKRAILALAILACTASAPALAPVEEIDGRVRKEGSATAPGWVIDRAGEVNFTVYADDPDYLTTRHVQVGPAGFAEIEAILAPLRTMVDQDSDCATSGDRGELAWTETESHDRVEFYVYRDCTSPRTDMGFARIEQARARIAKWAEGGEIVKTHYVGPSPIPAPRTN